MRAAPIGDRAWRHAGSLCILTTPEAADLPATAVERDFPLLVRLHRDFFDFSLARPHGEDVRFSASDGTPLAYELEQWDREIGAASIWVRIPRIEGNSRQEITMHWGNESASSESDGEAVLRGKNGIAALTFCDVALADE